jgi:hypothetical protein
MVRFRSFPLHSASENKLFHCGLPRPYSVCCLYFAYKKVTLPSLLTFSFTESPVPSSIPNIHLYSPLQIPTPKARHNSYPQSRCSPLPFSSWPLVPLSGAKVQTLLGDIICTASLTAQSEQCPIHPRLHDVRRSMPNTRDPSSPVLLHSHPHPARPEDPLCRFRHCHLCALGMPPS